VWVTLQSRQVVKLYSVELFDDKQMANWKEFVREPSWLDLGTAPAFTGRLGKTTKNLSRDSRYHGRDANLAPPEY
jgi:hypothetical protein